MKVLFLIVPAFVVMNTLRAADVITWEAAIHETANANSELNAAKSLLQASAYKVKESFSGFLPVISTTAGYSIDSSQSPKYYSTSVNATENLFSGFADLSKMNQAKYGQSSSEANLESVKAKISFDLKNAFMGGLYAQKYIKLTEDIITRREANLKLVQLRFESGRENIGSLHLSKAYLAQSQYEHLQAQHSLENYQTQIATVLGRSDFDAIEVVGEIPSQVFIAESKQKINYKNLVQDIPDYKKALYSEKIALASIDISHSAFYPSLNLTQSVSRTGRESSSPNNTWAIGASVTFSLFNGGKDYYTYKSTSEEYRASALNRKNIEETSVTKLKQAYTSYIEAVMKLEVDQAFSLAASSRERIAKAQYNNGLITFTDWDSIENDLIVRQKTLLETERERVIAEATWEQAQGKGVIP